jgi:leader peptidase (prepilin peptidase)/N-methyltransferase
VLTPLALLLGLIGAGWGFVSDRLATRWPDHDEENPAGRRIGWRTVVVGVTGAVALAAVALRFTDPPSQVVFGLYVVALVLLLATDLDQRLLPDVITLPAIPIALALDLLRLNPFVGPPDLPITIAVAVLVPLALAVVAIPFGAGAIGQGDLKLLVSVGLLAGPLRMFTGVVYGALLAGVVIVVLLVARRITLKTFIPFGPFLIYGALWAVLVLR